MSPKVAEAKRPTGGRWNSFCSSSAASGCLLLLATPIDQLPSKRVRLGRGTMGPAGRRESGLGTVVALVLVVAAAIAGPSACS